MQIQRSEFLPIKRKGVAPKNYSQLSLSIISFCRLTPSQILSKCFATASSNFINHLYKSDNFLYRYKTKIAKTITTPERIIII